ncbi:MAG: AmmeMemoRadiSam system radical SAM enzyme [Calditrichaeota bacterium]|nr:AmmeMemoRadiSam system radical SAM enzyme [Calditrichota bacterium]
MNFTQSIPVARWWQPVENNRVLCTLCPRYCNIPEGKAGFCFVRKNVDGKLYSTAYGRPTGFAVDPIEKKPLNHFYPGTTILSFGTAGCNLGCKFCQNWSMSKARLDESHALHVSPEEVVRIALKNHCPSIAFTYNDPIIFGEYVIDISKIAHQANIKTVMVTNGYIDKDARKEVFEHIDAANVDLKAFSEQFYFQLTGAHLQPVLDTLIWLKKETEVWFEITTLLIPNENDAEDEIGSMCDWILDNLGDSVPLHFTAFHPDFKMLDHPPTSYSTLRRAREVALRKGIKFCYTGNVHDPEGQTTFCPNCKEVLIRRDWYRVSVENLADGSCSVCGAKIAGRW